MPLMYRKVDQGQAMVITRPGKISVSFTPRLIAPLVNRVEFMDISLNTIDIDRRGEEGLICQDNIRADIKVTFFVRVNKTDEDVVRVAQTIGCKRASDPQTLEQLFTAKFSEALKTVGKQLDFVDLYTKREEFRDRIIEVIGRDLNGYVLEDAAIDYLEQTPLKALDPQNILDAEGIRKITELTAQQHVKTNEFENFEKKQITKQDVEARETILELERQQADAEARQAREIATVLAREQAETQKVQAEERLRSETARIKTAEEVEIQEENRMRQVAVAAKNKERVIAVENERIEKDRLVEVISRERETELQRIDKDKEIETQKKAIADVIRERVAVDRTVAEEEERIKELRVVEEAKRLKQAQIVEAEGIAQEALVKDIKAAEAKEQAATHIARQKIVLAEAELEASDKQAQAKIRMAEGIKAEAAAHGLAEVQVKEQNALALEKEGLAEATVLRQKMEAEAAGIEDKAKAMAALSDATREHEEYRIRLDKEKEVELEAIEAQRAVAEVQAQMLSKALESANIDIVGGESEFFDKLVNSIAAGKSLDRFFAKSEVASKAAGDYLNGKANVADDVKLLAAGLAGNTEKLQHVTVASFLARLMANGDDAERDKVAKLLDAAKQLGIAELDSAS